MCTKLQIIIHSVVCYKHAHGNLGRRPGDEASVLTCTCSMVRSQVGLSMSSLVQVKIGTW